MVTSPHDQKTLIPQAVDERSGKVPNHGPHRVPGSAGRRPSPGCSKRLRPRAMHFDLESQADRRRLQNPEMMLGELEGVIVLDEIQQMPELFSVLRVLADRPKSRSRFLILGSASPDLIRNASETLAGRVQFIEISGFDLSEAGAGSPDKLWLRGGFPDPISRTPKRKASPGAKGSSGRFSNAISLSWASPFRRRRCGVSGPCWPIITARRGMGRNWVGPWVFRIRPFVPTWMSSPVRSWCGSFCPGTKT